MNTPRAASFLGLVLLAGAAWGDAADERAVLLNERGLRLAEEGRLEDAVSELRRAVEAAPGNETIRKNLGRCEANWGVELLAKGDLLSAEQATRRARDLLPEDPVVRLNLASCLDERGYPARAAAEVKKALELAPALALAHDRTAHVHYREGRLAEAVASWEKALSLGPDEKGVAARLADAREELAAEERLARRTSAHFEILFDMERDAVLASKVLVAMEEAHDVVGAELQRFGQEKLRIVLLPTAEFRALTGSHGWVAGLYDGRIRLPVKEAAQREAELLARARHEYVHSVLAPLGRRSPPWLHEGLAQHFEGRSSAQALRRLALRDALPFEGLSATFANTAGVERARLQYDTAFVFVSWLRDGERASAFRAAMSSLFDDATLEDAFKLGYDAPLPKLYERFQETVPR